MSDNEPPDFSLTSLANGWHVGRFAALDEAGRVVHAVTTRRGLDVQLVARDRRGAAAMLAEALGLDAAACCRQVHGTRVLRVASGGLAGEGDALITDRPGLGLVGFSADCPLVLAADAAGAAVGIAHASWRGTVAGLPRRLIEAMAEKLAADRAGIVACIAPSAGPCCYEVGGEVRDAATRSLGLSAERFFRARAGGKFLFDLWSAIRDQLLRAGLAGPNVHAAGLCTICRNDLFPSYRRQGQPAGRFAAIIGRRTP